MEINAKVKEGYMKRLIFLGLLCSFLQAQTFTIYTEQLPPYNFLENGKVVGSSTQLLKELLEKTGHKIYRDTIELVPWSRGYHEAQNTEGTILYSVARTLERENLFKWVGPINQLTVGLVAKKSLMAKNLTPTCLANYTIGVMHDTAAESMLLNLGIKITDLERFSNPQSQLKKLKDGRVDMVAFGVEGLYFMIKDAGFNPADYETVYVLKEADLYFAFHKDTDDELIMQLNKTLKSIKK